MTTKKRLTLSVNAMPVEIAEKLQELGENRSLTPYIVSLVEKEERMDKLIEIFSNISNQMESYSADLKDIKNMLNTSDVKISTSEQFNEQDNEIVQEGKLEVSDTIIGGIEEEIQDTYDF